MEKVTEVFACKCFETGIDASQITFGHCAEKLGLDEKTALKISSAFGGGMWNGETCGCVVGALMALGYKYGNDAPDQKETKKALLAKKTEFEEKFKKENGSLVCREILGYDISKPEGMDKIKEKGLFFTICPKAVVTACKILDEIL